MYLTITDAARLAAEIGQMNSGPRDSFCLFVAERNCPDIEELIAALNDRGISFFGGVFPGVISGGRRYDEGVVVRRLPALAPPSVVVGLDSDHPELPTFGPEVTNAGEKYTAIVLVDGLTSNISSLLSALYNRLGNSYTYFGGGAGSLSLEPAPCVFTSEGFFQNAAVVAFISKHSTLGVRHGWKHLMGPVVATRTEHNVIVELNWRNAFEVYREVVEQDSGAELTRENYFEVTKGYPFGMYREGFEDIVRDPIAVDDRGALICVGEVPENTVLNILKGEPASLIAAAGEAATACGSLGEGDEALVVDCISRVLYLEDAFADELEALGERLAPEGLGQTLEGVLSLGEIAAHDSGLVQFLNKTVVAGVLRD
jgi:hypothetical protein